MSESDLPKLQHYVPQFLLREFTVEGADQIYVYDKKRERSFRTNISNVAAEKGFYNVELEGDLLSAELPLGRLESAAAQVIKKVIDQESLARVSDEEKKWLSYFVAAQLVRTKNQRIQLKQMGDDLKEKIRQMGFEPSDVENLEDWDIDEIKKSSVLSLRKMLVGLMPYIYEKPWLLFRSPSSESYYISDNPVVMQNMNDRSPRGNLGLAVRGIEIYMPISARLRLAILCPSHAEGIREGYRNYLTVKRAGALDKIEVDPTSTKALKRLKYGLETGNATTSRHENLVNANSLQVIYSTRFVCSRDDNFDLVREMINDDPDLKGPPQMVVV